MLRFIHTYTEESFEGLFLQGLWREGDGLKLMHKNYLPADRQFNKIAAPGSLLYQRLQQLNCYFYIDRLLGGIEFPYKYTYDQALLQTYAQMLGDKFLGFQMHEWASNFESDSRRLLQVKEKWLQQHGSLEGMWAHYIPAVRTDPMALFVEAWSVEEWAEMEHPADVQTFLREMYRLWQTRAREAGAPLFPADSGYLAPRVALQCGARLLLPEIGWQIAGTRLQVAYNRGMAKAAGIPWGVYYECWALDRDADGVLTIPYAADSDDNEWTELQLRGEMLHATAGNTENGGSSRSLQERMWMYAWFAGAEFMAEEYGVCNTFRNYTDFALSEYGRVKKKFLDFTAAHPDPGTPYTPVAVVLPADLPVYTNEPEGQYLGCPAAGLGDAFVQNLRQVRKTIGRLFFLDRPGYDGVGGDAHCLATTDYPDVFDVLHEDMAAALQQYDYILDLTGSEAFAAAHDNIVSLQQLSAILPGLLPCTFDGRLHTAYNRTAEGWLVLVMNNDGVLRSVIDGEHALEEFAVTARVCLRSPAAQVEKLCGSGRLHSCGDGHSVLLGAGQWMILTVKE